MSSPRSLGPNSSFWANLAQKTVKAINPDGVN